MKALIIVDVQNDFLPGGALAVPCGDEIIKIINAICTQFDYVVATQDWHPANHGSFAANHPGRNLYEQIQLNGLTQTLWPVHCVQNTWGAELAVKLDKSRIHQIFQKGIDPEIDSYSGFFDNGHRRATGLGDWLEEHRVQQANICGLATDYCVKYTAIDAVDLGYETVLLEDACRGVNLQPSDVSDALKVLKKAGVKIEKYFK